MIVGALNSSWKASWRSTFLGDYDVRVHVEAYHVPRDVFRLRGIRVRRQNGVDPRCGGSLDLAICIHLGWLLER